MPGILKMGGDGMYSASFAQDAGLAAENWYATIAAPDTIDEPQAQDWVAKYKSKYGASPQDYALTAYDAVYVINDTVTRLLNDGMPITRENVRDYAQATNLPTLQGTISFDDNGDLKDKVISVFQVKDALYKYIGAAPQS
jgi:branched-chain amino acid transport system substrate-binding protein